jgi:hypothetical protein
MFGLKSALPIDPVKAQSAFEKLSALLRAFPEIDFRKKQTILPRDLKVLHFNGSAEALDRLAHYISTAMQVDRPVKTVFLRGEQAKARAAAIRAEREQELKGPRAAGVYVGPGEGAKADEGPVVAIDLESFAGASPAVLVFTLAHEYAHHLLHSRPGIDLNDEELADYLPVLFGFGVFGANSAFTYETYGRWAGYMTPHRDRAARLGYVNEEVLAFAAAIVSAWRKEKPRPIRSNLKTSVDGYFSKSLRFLATNRVTFWDAGEDGAAARGSEDLGAWLTRAAERIERDREPRPEPEARIKRVEVKWAGTFLVSLGRVQDESGVHDAVETVDFGRLTAKIQLKSDSVFGLAYRVVSDTPAVFEIEEALVRPVTATPVQPGAPCPALVRRIAANALSFFLMHAGSPLFDEAGEWTFELRHGGATLLSKVFTLYC